MIKDTEITHIREWEIFEGLKTSGPHLSIKNTQLVSRQLEGVRVLKETQNCLELSGINKWHWFPKE